jgi:hypothetical protein
LTGYSDHPFLIITVNTDRSAFHLDIGYLSQGYCKTLAGIDRDLFQSLQALVIMFVSLDHHVNFCSFVLIFGSCGAGDNPSDSLSYLTCRQTILGGSSTVNGNFHLGNPVFITGLDLPRPVNSFDDLDKIITDGFKRFKSSPWIPMLMAAPPPPISCFPSAPH